MDYRGVIIAESLADTSVLEALEILETKVEMVTPRHKTPWLKQWTLHTVGIPEKSAESIAGVISRSLDREHQWYSDFKNDRYHYIIFTGKVFRVDLKKPIQYREAKTYGVAIGIPEYQVNFVPDTVGQDT